MARLTPRPAFCSSNLNLATSRAFINAFEASISGISNIAESTARFTIDSTPKPGLLLPIIRPSLSASVTVRSFVRVPSRKPNSRKRAITDLFMFSTPISSTIFPRVAAILPSGTATSPFPSALNSLYKLSTATLDAASRAWTALIACSDACVCVGAVPPILSCSSCAYLLVLAFCCWNRPVSVG